ncbi:MAG: hypothetical protein COB53_13475 [Elusimicrobia bacterium]|nr:MAG: hypothetical protein COB53_13475 [Elusimicrobiota bacterium]
MLGIGLKLGAAGLIVFVPFFVLIRSSVYFYLTVKLPVWVSMGLGVCLTVLLLLVYLHRLKGDVSLLGGKILLGVVGVYCLYTVLYIAPGNSQSNEIRETFRALNPILRLATGTWTVFDRGLVVTGTSRKRSDYAKMGLPEARTSMHYVQKNGYVHGVDLRVKERSFVRNLATRAYFEVLGFRTLRHVGTADHLHVSLPLP